MRDQIYGLYARALAGEHVQIEKTVAAPGGTGTFLISVHPIVEDGAIVGATVFSKDVTERKRAEEQARLHQAELAHVLLLGTMGEMAAGLAHEINQPLGAIANFASGAAHRRRARSMSAEDLLPVVEQIAAEALRGGEIIRRLRDLVRKEDPAPEPADLNPLATAALRLVEAEARQREVTLRADLAADLPPVRANATQIEQVVLNLHLNAIDAVERDPAGARLITVRSAATAAGADVAVEDSGPGLPPPPADVFAPFFTTKGSGLGLGLSISRSIVEAPAVRLDARANPGGGSTFVMSLPRAAETA